MLHAIEKLEIKKKKRLKEKCLVEMNKNPRVTESQFNILQRECPSRT